VDAGLNCCDALRCSGVSHTFFLSIFYMFYVHIPKNPQLQNARGVAAARDTIEVRVFANLVLPMLLHHQVVRPEAPVLATKVAHLLRPLQHSLDCGSRVPRPHCHAMEELGASLLGPLAIGESGARAREKGSQGAMAGAVLVGVGGSQPAALSVGGAAEVETGANDRRVWRRGLAAFLLAMAVVVVVVVVSAAAAAPT
jgi:hypothetical protein